MKSEKLNCWSAGNVIGSVSVQWVESVIDPKYWSILVSAKAQVTWKATQIYWRERETCDVQEVHFLIKAIQGLDIDWTANQLFASEICNLQLFGRWQWLQRGLIFEFILSDFQGLSWCDHPSWVLGLETFVRHVRMRTDLSLLCRWWKCSSVKETDFWLRLFDNTQGQRIKDLFSLA